MLPVTQVAVTAAFIEKSMAAASGAGAREAAAG
jgi:hypothetical protein